MTEPTGIPSVLGVESVEWLAEGRENLTVRVTGRWRRRRPAWSAQPVLVVEAAGRRFRFPAMPEPPSLTGTSPGMWRISFAVPAALAPELGGRIWLAVGAVVVPLPAAVEQGPQAADAPDEAPPSTISPPSPELEHEHALRSAREADDAQEGLATRVRELEGELEAARREAERLNATLEERERTRRAAEQRAHAEHALRRDLARQLAGRDRDHERTREQLVAVEQRVHELEAELHEARRRGDEAEQLAAAAVAARQRAERRTEEAEPDVQAAAVPTAPTGALELERALRHQRSTAAGRVPAEPSAVVVVPSKPLAREPEPPEPEPGPPGPEPPEPASPSPLPGDPAELIPALRNELEARASTEAALRARLIGAEAALRARVLIERRTSGVLSQLRQELDGLRTAFDREREARLDAQRRAEELARELNTREQRTEEAHTAIAELRQALASLRVQPTPPPRPVDPEGSTHAQAPAGEACGNVEPERLNDARQRLRAAIAPRGPDAVEPGPAATPAGAQISGDERTERAWLSPIWSSLARADPATAGRMLIELLPAQGEAYSQRIAYDLVFGEGRGCAQVTAGDGPPVIRHADGPRAREEVDFQVLGSPEAIARLLTAGAFRRRFGRGVARVRGRRDRLEALRSLPAVKLDLRGLHRIGVRLEPELALRLVALMIEPSWTARERFAVAYAVEGAPTRYLLVRDGAPVEVTADAPAGRIATTIEGPGDAAALVLSGERTDEVTITGEDWPLALLRKWIKRAQSG